MTFVKSRLHCIYFVRYNIRVQALKGTKEREAQSTGMEWAAFFLSSKKIFLSFSRSKRDRKKERKKKFQKKEAAKTRLSKKVHCIQRKTRTETHGNSNKKGRTCLLHFFKRPLTLHRHITSCLHIQSGAEESAFLHWGYFQSRSIRKLQCNHVQVKPLKPSNRW